MDTINTLIINPYKTTYTFQFACATSVKDIPADNYSQACDRFRSWCDDTGNNPDDWHFVAAMG